MSRLEKFTVDDVEWEAWEGFGENDVIYQRRCPDCDSGLLLAPARFCPRCDRGFLTQREDPRKCPCPCHQMQLPHDLKCGKCDRWVRAGESATPAT